MRRSRVWTGLVVAALLATTTACSSTDGSSDGGGSGSAGDCPGQPVEVVVTVAQWRDVVEQLGGGCVDVTTIITGADVDPHDFEPSPRDSAAFTDADLVVVNGLGYDHWADDALATLDSRPAVVDAGQVAGRRDGDDPHLWYDPLAVQQVSAAVTAALEDLLPEAREQLVQQSGAWAAELQPVLDEIALMGNAVRGTTYAATETVFDQMAAAIGLVDVTPEGYRRAARNESEPSPADINAFQRLLRSGSTAVGVLIVNTQTEGSVPSQLRSIAEGAGVPVVEVTESPPTRSGSFVDWHLAQLRALGTALGAGSP
jgi:zinc/manganese transport system substrate-binding protein